MVDQASGPINEGEARQREVTGRPSGTGLTFAKRLKYRFLMTSPNEIMFQTLINIDRFEITHYPTILNLCSDISHISLMQSDFFLCLMIVCE